MLVVCRCRVNKIVSHPGSKRLLLAPGRFLCIDLLGIGHRIVLGLLLAHRSQHDDDQLLQAYTMTPRAY